MTPFNISIFPFLLLFDPIKKTLGPRVRLEAAVALMGVH
jgi:hypothetical protein